MLGSLRYALASMRSTPDQDEQLRLRLEEAVRKFAGGSADKFGQMIGYANGGYVRECLKKIKPVRESIIERVHAHIMMRGWFSAHLSPIASNDVGADEERALLEAFRALPVGSTARRDILMMVRGAIIGSGLGGASTPPAERNPHGKLAA